MKYYTVETRAVSIDPNRDYTIEEIAGLYSEHLCNLDGTVEFYEHIDTALVRYKEIDEGVINVNRGSVTILLIAEVYGWEAPIRVPLVGHPTDLDIECLGIIKPEDTVKHIHKMLKAYRQHKAGK